MIDFSSSEIPNSSDCISRQAAIDAIQKEINERTPAYDEGMGAIRCGVRLARNIIEDLPPAPERTGKRYRHFKGRLYEVVCEAWHSESLEQLVIYRSLDTGRVWARPRDMFYGKTEDGMQRFTEVDG